MTAEAQTTSGGARLVSVIEQLVAAMGWKGAVEGAETEAITANGWRLHPGWGTEPPRLRSAGLTHALLPIDSSQESKWPRY
jgi:hypothetical protein